MYEHNKGEFYLVLSFPSGFRDIKEEMHILKCQVVSNVTGSKLRYCVPFKKTSCVTLNHNSGLFHLKVFAIQVVTTHLYKKTQQ